MPRLFLATFIAVASALLSTSAQADQASELQTMQRFIDLMQGYYAIIEATHDIASDEERATILHLQKIKEAMDESGQRARAVETFERVLTQTTNPAIRNATYLLLSETLKENGKTDDAIDVLKRALDENIKAAENKPKP